MGNSNAESRERQDGFIPFPATPAQVEELHSIIRRREVAHNYNDARADSRYEAATLSVPMLAEHIGGGESKCYIGVFDISSGGLGAIHRGYLHVGTTIQVWLAGHNGAAECVNGEVRWCEHLSNRYHAFGMRYEHQIDPRPYISPKELMRVRPPKAKLAEKEVVGSAIVYETSPHVRRLVTAAVARTKLEVLEAVCAGDVHDRLRKAPVDLIILGCGAAPDQDAIQFARRLRHRGYRGALLHLAQNVSDDYAAEAADANIDQLLAAPYEPGALLDAIRDAMTRIDVLASSRPITPSGSSSLPIEMVEEYITGVREDAARFARLCKSDQLDQLRSVVMGLMSTGRGFGFSPLTQVARETITKLDATMSIEESSAEIDRLRHVIDRLSSGADLEE